MGWKLEDINKVVRVKLELSQDQLSSLITEFPDVSEKTRGTRRYT